MFRRLQTLYCFFLLFGAATASADQARFLAELPPNEAEVVRAEIAKLSAAGLDTSPAMVKVREGLAKNIAPEKITQAVRQEVAMRLRSGRMLGDAGIKADAELVNSLALAMRRGAQEKDLAAALRKGGDFRALQQAIDLVGLLAQKGVTGDKAVESAWRETRSSGTVPDLQDATQKQMLYQQNIRRDEVRRLPPQQDTGHTGQTEPKIEYGQQGVMIR